MLEDIGRRFKRLLRIRARIRSIRTALKPRIQRKEKLIPAPRQNPLKNQTDSTQRERKPQRSRQRDSQGQDSSSSKQSPRRSSKRSDSRPRPQQESSSGSEFGRRTTPPPELPAIVESPAVEGKTRFTDLQLAKELIAGVQDLEFKYCTPIQAKCLPVALEGRDLAAKAQTGTGKTAAFLASSMTELIKKPKTDRRPGSCRVLVLAPTRELAVQIYKDALGLGKYTDLNNLVIFGGMDHKAQRDSLHDPVDILVGTPGRIIDYSGSGHLDLSQTEILIIDEADRMLDMGFIPDVRRIVSKLPPAGKRQTMLFSATLEPQILRLVEKWLVNPVSLETEPEHLVTELIDQRFYSVLGSQKLAMLLWLIKNDNVERMIIFGNWKEKNRILCNKLASYGIESELLSGDIPQTKRLKILDRFKSGDCRILVATDVAARGIHVDAITHVVNYDIPDRPEDYVHRIGRTGRAGAKGQAISFVCEFGAYVLPELEKLINLQVKSIQPEEAMLKLPPRIHAECDRFGSDETVHRRPSSGGRGRPSGGRRYPARRR